MAINTAEEQEFIASCSGVVRRYAYTNIIHKFMNVTKFKSFYKIIQWQAVVSWVEQQVILQEGRLFLWPK